MKVAIVAHGNPGLSYAVAKHLGEDVEIISPKEAEKRGIAEPEPIPYRAREVVIPYTKPRNIIVSDIGCPFDKKGRHVYERQESGSGLGKLVTHKCICGRTV